MDDIKKTEEQASAAPAPAELTHEELDKVTGGWSRENGSVATSTSSSSKQ
jgi:hypothetical protein